MDLNYQQHIPQNFPDNAHVWIYQCSRILSISEALELEKKLQLFLNDWNTHGSANRAFANLFFGQFLVLMADESDLQVSGCSTDSAVRFIKLLEKDFSVSFFDRQSLAFIIKDKVQLLPLAQLKYAVDNQFIDGNTLYFNNLVATKKEWETKWILPLKESWLAKRVAVTIE